MKLVFNQEIAANYTNEAQRIRVLSEDWVNRNTYCPNCGYFDIKDHPNNKPVADFYCLRCKEDYELKSKKNTIGKKITDGAYSTMISRLKSENNPNLFLLNYDPIDYSIKNFVVIPKHFFVPRIIEKRKPLTSTARRAGWVGCNILLKEIPRTGKIFYIRDRHVESKEYVLSEWNKTLFLREEKEVVAKGWLLDIMNCIEQLNKKEFTLNEMYEFKNVLEKIHPENKHIKDKIRQQLQVLRDKGYLEFISPGKYRLI